MANQKRTCYCCGRTYSYCPTCGEDVYKPTWYSMWDREECKDLDDILAKHTMKMLTTEEAKKKIEEKGLSGLDIVNEDTKKHLNEILGINTDTKKTVNVENVNVENVNVESEKVEDKKVEDVKVDTEKKEVKKMQYTSKNTSTFSKKSK